MTARVVVALVAVLLLAWLGVSEHTARLQARGLATVLAGPDSFDGADADLRRARFLNPDPTPDIYRAYLLDAEGQAQRAIALVDKVLRREPENLNAWAALLVVARGHDLGATRRARAALRRLRPISAGQAERGRPG